MASGSNIGALMVQLLLDDDDFNLEKPRKDLEKFGKQLQDFADAVEDAFIGAAKAVAAATAGIVAASAVVGANFQAQMDKVGVIAGATGDDFKDLEDKARELGATTAFSASEAAGAMELLASAGLGVNEILTSTGDVLSLAGAGGTDLNTAAAAVASTMAQFGLQAKESGRIVDVFARATADTQFQVEDLSEAMKYGGTVGAGFGWSLEQTVAALGMFRDLGLQGSMAGAALRSAMVGAANASAKNVEVLGKYGLTLADVSPDTHSFAEILLAVGKAGMSTSDAMIVFGTEAGAALNTLAQSAAEGSTKYQDLVASLEDATGTSATMYGQMQDNVLGSFKELQSAVEEGLLTLFDSFSGPLGRLLDAVTEKIGVVVEYFRNNAAGLTEELEAQVDAVIGWLDENGNLIAVTFTEGARALVDLLGLLGQLVPLLDEIGIALAGVFVAKKVLDFAMGVQTLISGLSAASTGVGVLQAALAALGVELTVSTGGLYALVAAVGAAVAAIAYLVSSYGEAEEAARKLRLEQERGIKVSEVMSQKIMERYGDEISASKANADAKKVELAAAGKLTSARREELDILRRSTEEQLAALVAQGKLIEYAGELRTVTSLYEELEEDALVPVQKRYREMAKDQRALTTQADELASEIAYWEARGSGQAELWAKSAKGFAGGMEEAKAQVTALRAEADELADGMKGLEGANADAQATLLETYSPKGPVGRGMEDLGEKAGQLGKDQEDAARRAEEAWERAFQTAVTAATNAAEQQREMLEDVNADEEEALRLKHERELRDLERAKEDALAEVQDNVVAQMLVEAQFADAKASMEKRHAVETRRFQWEQTKAELEEKKAALDERTAAHARSLDAVKALERENMTALQRFDAEMADFFVENATLTVEERARAEAAFAVQRQKLVDEEAQAVKEAADAEKAARQEAMRAALQTVKDVVNGIGTVVSAVARGVQVAAQTVAKFLGGVIDLAKQVVGAVTEVFNALTGGEVSLDALGFISEALDAITSGEAGGASVGDVAASFVEEMAANAQLFLDGVIEGLPTVIAALMEQVPTLVQSFAEALPIIAQQLADIIPDLVDILAENIPVVVEGIVTALPIIVEAIAGAIPELVTIIAENLPILVQGIVDNLPTIVTAIADAIPQLVQVIADNLPIVVQALVDALPEIVDAVIDSIPILVDALGGSLPILIDGIIQEVPRLITAILEALPSIAQVISDAIVQILSSLGDIIDQNLSALPEVITGILDAVPQIISAVFEAIPDIIENVIANLPAIIQALLEGVLAIIVHIAEELPGLITEILRMIPDIIDTLLAMLPDIITAIIAAIPDIIFGLIDGLPDIITALVMLIPDLIVAIIANLPDIIVALVQGLVVEIIANLPQIVWELITALVEGLADAVSEIAEMIWDALTGKGGKKDKSSNYSGISYVPATMRGVTLHPGEAVLTAPENARRLFGGAAGASQSNPGVPVMSGGGGGMGNLEALFAVDGRVVDGVLVRANANGKGEIVNMMKRKAGVRSGVKTSSRFKLWSK